MISVHDIWHALPAIRFVEINHISPRAAEASGL
jgi:hypothetical protein